METRICKKCNEEKSIESFRKCGKGNRRPICKECEYGHKPHDKNVEEKVCTTCGELKSIEDFGFMNRTKGFRDSSCKRCRNIRRDAQRKSSLKERIRQFKKYNKNYKYNLNVEEYERIYKEQEGRCFICNKDEVELKKVLCIDHCHTSGKVRGLLCNKCNTVLGFAGDSVEVLKRAIIYLERYEE